MKKFLSLAIALMMAFCLMVPAMADEIGAGIAGETATATATDTSAAPVETEKDTTTTSSNETTKTTSRYHVEDPEEMLGLPTVTIDTINDKIDQKGGDIISVIQKICQYICIGAFIIGAVQFLVGLLGNKKTMATGILCLVLSGVLYAAVTCAPEIVKLIGAWAAT